MPEKLISKLKGNSVEQLVQWLRTDKLLRIRFLCRLSETMQEFVVSGEDMKLLPSLEEDFTGGDPANLVFVHKSDSKKNSTTIIVGGSKPQK